MKRPPKNSDQGVDPTIPSVSGKDANAALRDEAWQILSQMGFIAKEHISVVEKLLQEPPAESFERVVNRQWHTDQAHHLQRLRKLARKARALDQQLDDLYSQHAVVVEAQPIPSPDRHSVECHMEICSRRLKETLLRFSFAWCVLEEAALVAFNIEATLRREGFVLESGDRRPVPSDRKEHVRQQLESFARMPGGAFCVLAAQLRGVLLKLQPEKWSE